MCVCVCFFFFFFFCQYMKLSFYQILYNLNFLINFLEKFLELPLGCLQCGAVFNYFQHYTLQCNLVKTIITHHFIFAVTCAMLCNLEFSQNYHCTLPHFCGHMCSVVYKMWFEVGIFFKFWVFPAQSKTNFSLYFEPNFKLLSQFFLYFVLTFLINTCQSY